MTRGQRRFHANIWVLLAAVVAGVLTVALLRQPTARLSDESGTGESL